MDAEQKVAWLLLEFWDPLGVADVDYWPEQEYLAEAQQVVARLRRAADLAEVAALLTNARLGRVDERRDRRAAAEIVRWWGSHWPDTA